MSERLKSVGLDIGTTSTQMILSELTVENRASSFAVPELEISERKILYKSPVYFTPLLDEKRMDAGGLRRILEEEYRRAGITREDVDTGALIMTGETSRKENAKAVLEALPDLAGDFVVATAGPDLESVLAAKGAGAVEYSEKTGETVLHMDIGGGTSNLALIREGKILDTGCLNVGGRLVKFGSNGAITYVSPVLQGICTWKTGDRPEEGEIRELAEMLAQALEMAAGRREATALLELLTTAETGRPWVPPEGAVTVSFSGGVADCIGKDRETREFGDIGPALGRAIRESRLCREKYVLGQETIRATVIGAGCHSAQLSGSTVFHQNVQFPLKNLPVVTRLGAGEEERVIYALPGLESPGYRQVAALAEEILKKVPGEIFLCLEGDMGKALGQALALRGGRDRTILCIDRVRAAEGSFLDIGAPVGGAMPVVVKTLVLGGSKFEGDCHASVSTGSQ